MHLDFIRIFDLSHMMFNKNKRKIHCQNVTAWETVHKKKLSPVHYLTRRVDSSSFFLGPVLLVSLIKNVDSRLHMMPSQEGLQRLWRMKMILKNWGNGLKQRGGKSVWKSRQCAWALMGAARGWSGWQISFSSVKELGARANKRNMNEEGQAVTKPPNIILGCINNVGICKKHEIVLLLSHLIWSTGSSLGHCISRKMRISWKESKETSMIDWGSGKHGPVRKDSRQWGCLV